MVKKLFRNRKTDRIIEKLSIENSSSENTPKQEKYNNMPKSLDMVEEELKTKFDNTIDFVLKEIEIFRMKILVCFLDGLVDKQTVNENVLKPLLYLKSDVEKDRLTQKHIIDLIREDIFSIGGIKETIDFNKSIDAILSGDTAIYIENHQVALLLSTKGWEARGVEKPETELVVRGPREGFTETLGTNITLIRRKIKSTKLKFELIQIGEVTKTDICLCYIKGIVNEKVLETVRKKLKNISTDAILESEYIEEFIEDKPITLFPTIGNTEKPDKVAGKILEGRIAIFCDGTPFVLTVPYLFIENIQTSEDYYTKPGYASFIRLLRLLALFITLTLPAFYVAITSFHVKVIPFELMLSIAAANEGIPFTPFIEALIMIVIFELLREAGIRMPRPVGQAVSIVGALVIGDAIVKAGFVSSPIVIVTALTAITSFIIPATTVFVGVLRIFILIAASILGFMGMFLSLMFITLHLCSLSSFGIPYLYPMASLDTNDLKDTFIRLPMWMLITRPRMISWKNRKRNSCKKKVHFRKKED